MDISTYRKNENILMAVSHLIDHVDIYFTIYPLLNV